MQFWAPDDGRKTRLKHVESLTEINNLRKVASFWLYFEYTATNVYKCPAVYLQRTKLSQKSVPMYQNTRCHIPKECTFIPFSCGNLKYVSTVGDWIIYCIINFSARMNEVNHTDTNTESFEVPLPSFIYAGMNWPWAGWQRLLHHPILALVYFKVKIWLPGWVSNN